ncbi:hypothetical protein KQX54_021810 [Cotesia glomerata]|uniref:Uncharacterized protein n=1 Tax=Cotesia glomerata TaxID=32391 RepID=A0AAV7J9L1_COTGL|nr:hypothetical protein KQX54_021810 [Cotesia glomerata]
MIQGIMESRRVVKGVSFDTPRILRMKNAAIDLHGRVKSRVGCTEDEAKGRKILEISTTFTVEGSSKGVSSYTTSEIEKNTSEALLVDSVPKECVWVDAVDQRVIASFRAQDIIVGLQDLNTKQDLKLAFHGDYPSLHPLDVLSMISE